MLRVRLDELVDYSENLLFDLPVLERAELLCVYDAKERGNGRLDSREGDPGSEVCHNLVKLSNLRAVADDSVDEVWLEVHHHKTLQELGEDRSEPLVRVHVDESQVNRLKLCGVMNFLFSHMLG